MKILNKDFDDDESFSIEKCRLCNGKGIVEIFRDDLEEFEPIKCYM